MTLRRISFCRLAWLIVLVGLLGGVAPRSAVGQSPDWTQLTTVEAVYNRYPTEVEALLNRLDLDAPGLSDVRAAIREGRTVRAARALLDYYRTAETAPWLRDYASEANEGTYIARQILQGTYRFKGAQIRFPGRRTAG